MDRTTIESTAFPECPIRNILARICDKWSLVVIYTLDQAKKENIRFKELQRSIPDISDTRHIAKNVDRDAAHAGRGRLRHPHRLPGSAAQGGICLDSARLLPLALHQRTDWMGERKHGLHHERQEKGTSQSLVGVALATRRSSARIEHHHGWLSPISRQMAYQSGNGRMAMSQGTCYFEKQFKLYSWQKAYWVSYI